MKAQYHASNSSVHDEEDEEDAYYSYPFVFL